MRLRKWGTVIIAALAAHGGGDPLTQALDFTDHVDRVTKASRSDMAERARQTSTTASRSSRSALPPLLALIREHESSGDYTAVNPTGCDGLPCGGAYQLHSSYATIWADQAGYPGLSSNAATWEPATQDAVALHLFYSTKEAGWHWCQFTAYC